VQELKKKNREMESELTKVRASLERMVPASGTREYQRDLNRGMDKVVTDKMEKVQGDHAGERREFQREFEGKLRVKERDHDEALRELEKKIKALKTQLGRMDELEERNKYLEQGFKLQKEMGEAAEAVQSQITSLMQVVKGALKGSDSMITSDGAMITKAQLETWTRQMEDMNKRVQAFIGFRFDIDRRA